MFIISLNERYLYNLSHWILYWGLWSHKRLGLRISGKTARRSYCASVRLAPVGEAHRIVQGLDHDDKAFAQSLLRRVRSCSRTILWLFLGSIPWRLLGAISMNPTFLTAHLSWHRRFSDKNSHSCLVSNSSAKVLVHATYVVPTSSLRELLGISLPSWSPFSTAC